MNIAITGGTGFIGAHVLRLALERGHVIKALHRRHSILKTPNSSQLEWICGDLVSDDTWNRLLLGCDTLIHLGAAGVANVNDAFDAVHTNLPGLAHMMKSAARYNVKRLVLAGSCFEYGDTGEKIGERGLREDDHLCPINVYGAAKAAATLLAGPLSRDLGLECFVLRPFHTYGEGEISTRIIPSVIEAALAGRPIQTTDGRQLRDFVHVKDVAAGFIQAAEVSWGAVGNQTAMKILNLGTGSPTTLRDMIERLLLFCGRDVGCADFGARQHRPNEMWRLVSDSSEAERSIGWKPLISLGVGLPNMVSMLRK
jgi:nucleoside-diphosphate-sugar epimerase